MDETKTDSGRTRRLEAISKLAQAIDDAGESGYDVMALADALAEAAWRTHGIDADGNGTNVTMDDDSLAHGTEEFTSFFINAVRHG